jgi:hypothetical protein
MLVVIGTGTPRLVSAGGRRCAVKRGCEGSTEALVANEKVLQVVGLVMPGDVENGCFLSWTSRDSVSVCGPI